jgi:hypothetical protein
MNVMADPTNAAAGTDGPVGGQGNNPEGYSSAHDRNYWVMATILFKESFERETGGKFLFNPAQLWKETCEEPSGHRSPIPTWQWKLDPKIYGVSDSFGHEVEPRDTAPLLLWGSLRQFRDAVTEAPADRPDAVTRPGSGFPEDIIETANEPDAIEARKDREYFSFYAFYRDRICDPEFQYSIEEAVGDPRPYPTGAMIRDTSSARLRRYDMYVPATALGNSDFDRDHFSGCGSGTLCNAGAAPTYKSSSLMQWVYVCQRLFTPAPPQASI